MPLWTNSKNGFRWLPDLVAPDTVAPGYFLRKRSECVGVTSFRCFHNTDPPRIAALWQASNLGRGAADQFSADALEHFVFSQPFFDPAGLIVACEDEEVVGFAHAMCAVSEDESGLDCASGAITGLLVHPAWRRRGIGSELIARASAWLRDQGVSEVRLGPDDRTNGFYVGLYGGVQPRGFLASDGTIEAFAQQQGWRQQQTYRCYQKHLSQSMREPVNMTIIGNRRKTQLEGVDLSGNVSWWWTVRFGNLDSVRFDLRLKSGGDVVASCEAFGLDLYIPKWGQRAVGLGRVSSPPEHQGKDYELSLLLELSKYLRDQLITIIDASAAVDDESAVALLESAGFEHCDTGTVWTEPAESTGS